MITPDELPILRSVTRKGLLHPVRRRMAMMTGSVN
jgi:type IV secretory pathway TrbD component